MNKGSANSLFSVGSVHFYSLLFTSASIVLQTNWHSGRFRAPWRCGTSVCVCGSVCEHHDNRVREQKQLTCICVRKQGWISMVENIHIHMIVWEQQKATGEMSSNLYMSVWVCVCVGVCMCVCACWHGNTGAGSSQGNASCLLPSFYQSQFSSCLGAWLVSTVAPLSPCIHTEMHTCT